MPTKSHYMVKDGDLFVSLCRCYESNGVRKVGWHGVLRDKCKNCLKIIKSETLIVVNDQLSDLHLPRQAKSGRGSSFLDSQESTSHRSQTPYASPDVEIKLVLNKRKKLST